MQPDRVRNGHPRLLSAFLLLAALAACSLEDPSGTSWESGFYLSTAPETLRVRQAEASERIAFRSGDSLLLFLQELDSEEIRLADSLWWDGASRSLEAGPQGLRFTELGGSGLVIPLEDLFPSLADSLDSIVRLPQPIPFLLDLPLSPFQEVDWVHFVESLFRLEGEHGFAFELQELDIDVYNDRGRLLGSGSLTEPGSLPPGVFREEPLELLGLVTSELVLRLSGSSRPLDQSRLLSPATLELGLAHETGLADSARAHIGRQDFEQLDSLAADPGLRVLEALSREIDVSYAFHNRYEVPLSVEVLLPQFRTSAGDTLRSLSDVVQPGATVVIHDHYEQVRFLDLGERLPQQLPLLVRGHTLEVPGMQVLRTRDRLQMDVEVDPSRLDFFRGEFLEPYLVEIQPRAYPMDDLPAELGNFRFRDVDMELRLESSVGMLFDLQLELGVQSGNSLADTLLHAGSEVDTNDGRMLLEGMGPFLEREPESLDLSGELQLLPGQILSIDSLSSLRFTQVVLPAELVVLEALWESGPEEGDVELGREVAEAGLELFLENEIPLGGTLQAWVSSGNPRIAPADSIALFEPIAILPAGQGGNRDTLDAVIREQALRLMRGGRWDGRTWVPEEEPVEQWWGWYRFDAFGDEDTLRFHASQELRVTGRITLQARLGDWQ